MCYLKMSTIDKEVLKISKLTHCICFTHLVSVYNEPHPADVQAPSKYCFAYVNFYSFVLIILFLLCKFLFFCLDYSYFFIFETQVFMNIKVLTTDKKIKV